MFLFGFVALTRPTPAQHRPNQAAAVSYLEHSSVLTFALVQMNSTDFLKSILHAVYLI